MGFEFASERGAHHLAKAKRRKRSGKVTDAGAYDVGSAGIGFGAKDPRVELAEAAYNDAFLRVHDSLPIRSAHQQVFATGEMLHRERVVAERFLLPNLKDANRKDI